MKKIINIMILLSIIFSLNSCSALKQYQNFAQLRKLKADSDNINWMTGKLSANAIDSQYILGIRYCFGVNNTEIDKKEGLKWLRSALKNGHPEAEESFNQCKNN